MTDEQLNSWDDPASPLTHRLHDQLAGAAALLDAACQLILDHDFNKSENIRNIGEALAKIFEIQHQIYARRPDIKPVWFDEWAKQHAAKSERDLVGEVFSKLVTSIEMLRRASVDLPAADLDSPETRASISLAANEIQSILEKLYSRRPDLPRPKTRESE